MWNIVEVYTARLILSIFSPCSQHDSGDANSSTDSHDEETETITWAFKETIPAGTQANLTIKFQGSLNDTMAGEFI